MIVLPFVAAIIAYVTSLRSLFWLAERVEELVGRRLKEGMNLSLERWWSRIIRSPLPELAQSESKLILGRIDRFFSNENRSKFIKLNISVALTMTAFCLGHLIFALSYFFQNFNNTEQQNFLYSVLMLLFDVVFLIFMVKALRNPNMRQKIIFDWLLRYAYVGFVLSKIIYPIVSEKLIKNSGHFIPHILSVITIVLIVIGLEWFLMKNKKHGLLRFISLLILLIIPISILINISWDGFFYMEFVYPLERVYNELAPWIFNFLFDLLTFRITYSILKKISKGKTFKNALWLLLDCFLAALLAMTLYFVFNYLFYFTIGLSYGQPVSFFSVEQNIQQIYRAMFYSIDTNRYHLIFYSSTTLIPTLILFLVLFLAYAGKLTDRSFAYVSNMLFLRSQEKEKNSPIYRTLILFSFILSSVPAIIGFVIAKNALHY